jgi:alpha-tubulin suppressor-like RCC1 family protein
MFRLSVGIRARVCVVVALVMFMVCGTSSMVMAVPTPDQGPTVGGTAVSDSLPGVTFTSVSAGLYHSLAIGSDGTLYAWGTNDEGQLGDGTTTDSSVPVKVLTPAGVTFTSVAGGFHHSLAVSSDGDVYAWGGNGNGQLGNDTITESSVPVKVTPNGVTFTSVSAGFWHSLAVSSDGALYAWGGNSTGQLGNDTITDSWEPVQVSTPTGLTTFTSVSAGALHSLAVGSDGVTYAWGYNHWGQLGDGTTTNSSVPVAVLTPNEVTFTSVSAGAYHSLAISSDGVTYAWGNNSNGQLGNDTITESLVPVEVLAPTGVTFTSVSAGFWHSLAVGSGGVTYAWGNNTYGELGDGTITESLVPVEVLAPTGVTFTSVNAGLLHSLAVGTDGAYSWGGNASGQLGNGLRDDVLAPERVPDVVTVESVTFGSTPGTNLTQAGGQWTVTAPPMCGVVDVTVAYTQFGASKQSVFPGGFTFGTSPQVSEHPTSATLAQGDTLTLTAAASGDDMPTVQWQQAPTGTQDWQDITGETTTTLTTTVEASTDYRAAFTNCLATVTTNPATITMTTTNPTTAEPTTEPTDHTTATTTQATTGTGTALTSTGAQSLYLLLLLTIALATTGTLLHIRSRRTH